MNLLIGCGMPRNLKITGMKEVNCMLVKTLVSPADQDWYASYPTK